MTNSNVATINEASQQQESAPNYDVMSAGALLLDTANFTNLQSFAEIMAKGTVTVPKHLVGNVGDCMAVAMQALQWGMNPYAVAQKTHIVNGALGYEAQLVNAVVQATRAIKGSFRYEYQGEGQKIFCRVGAVIAGEQNVTWGEWLSAESVKVKNSPLWVTNPKQQLGYLQVKNWARAYCPGAILGVYTDDELNDYQPQPGANVYEAKAESIAPAQYPAERFEKQFPKHKQMIIDGEKTAKEIIASVETRFVMTDDQKLAYREFEKELQGEKQ